MGEAVVERSGLDRSAIRLLQLTALVSTLDRFAMPPMLVAISRDLNLPLSSVVRAAGGYFLAYGLTQPVWGIVSDRLGLVRTLRVTLVLAAFATTTAAFAGTALQLGVSRALAGACFSAAIPGALVYVGDTVPAHRRHRDITDLMAGVAVGTALAAVGAGAVADYIGWQVAFLVTGIAAVVLAVALDRLPRPPRTRNHTNPLAPLAEVFRSPAARLVLALAFAEGVVLLGALTLLPAAVESTGASPFLAGAVTAFYGVAVLAFARIVGRLSQRMSSAVLIAAGAGATFAACLLAAASTAAPVALGVSVLLGVAWASMHSSLQTWATEVVPPARASAVAMFAGSLFAGSALGTVLVGRLAEQARYPLIFALGAVAAVPLGLVGAFGRARWRGPERGDLG
ncbi:MAG TPA: MFS transporter [Micromonosporaceae bacterium]